MYFPPIPFMAVSWRDIFLSHILPKHKHFKQLDHKLAVKYKRYNMKYDVKSFWLKICNKKYKIFKVNKFIYSLNHKFQIYLSLEKATIYVGAELSKSKKKLRT